MKINSKYIKSISKLSQDFRDQSPCKFVVLDDFLDEEIADQLFSSFPALDSLQVKRKSLKLRILNHKNLVKLKENNLLCGKCLCGYKN